MKIFYVYIIKEVSEKTGLTYYTYLKEKKLMTERKEVVRQRIIEAEKSKRASAMNCST